MKLLILQFFSIATILTSCHGQTTKQPEHSVKADVVVLKGDTVQELGKNIMVIYQDKSNVYWFGSWETGLYRYDARQNGQSGRSKTLINYTTKHGLAYNRIDEIKEDSAGNIYINGGYPYSAITKFDGHSFTKLSPYPSTEWKLQANDLWFKHPNITGQVYRYDGKVLHELTLPKHPKYSDPFEIYSIYKDFQGNLWFGTNPVGVCRYNGKSFDWIYEDDVTELHNGPANGVRSILQDKNGNFWFNSAFTYKIQDRQLSGNNSFYQRQTSIGSLDGKKDGNLNEYLSSLKDNQGNLWFATYVNGVWKYDGSKVSHYTVQHNSKDIKVFSIYKDNKGDIWLGTHENGAFKFNGEKFEQVTLN